jgi:hypothetical protein
MIVQILIRAVKCSQNGTIGPVLQARCRCRTATRDWWDAFSPASAARYAPLCAHELLFSCSGSKAMTTKQHHVVVRQDLA